MSLLQLNLVAMTYVFTKSVCIQARWRHELLVRVLKMLADVVGCQESVVCPGSVLATLPFMPTASAVSNLYDIVHDSCYCMRVELTRWMFKSSVNRPSKRPQQHQWTTRKLEGHWSENEHRHPGSVHNEYYDDWARLVHITWYWTSHQYRNVTSMT